MNTPLDAVPTTYAGVLFRSRLEADWARTLDIHSITWEYEPETITLPSGAQYVPDFWLPDLGTWLEAKGPGIPRIEKTLELAQSRACHCPNRCGCHWPGGELVLIGREPLRDTGTRHTRHGYANWETAHGPSAYFTTCPACRAAQWTRLARQLQCRFCLRPMPHGTALHPATGKHVRFAEPADGIATAFGDAVFADDTEWNDPA